MSTAVLALTRAAELAARRGIIHLPPEDEARGYRELVTEERAKKYGLL